MMARSDGNAARAVREGAARVLSAPALLAGTLALTFLFSVPVEPSLTRVSVFSQYVAVLTLLPFGGALYPALEPAWLVIWAFLGGGILDRYARNRPTRGRGFFGACGAHFPAMLRLAVAEWLVGLAAARAGLDQRAGYGAIIVALAVSVFFLYARVRLVVEDRRSAIGALRAGGRFIRRNAAAVPLFLIIAAALWLGTRLWEQLAVDLLEPTLLQFVESELIFALLLFLVLASWASAIAFFQARLAHASYTAAPPIEWPESPAAEAIVNLSTSVPRERSGASDEARAQCSEPQRGAGGNRREAPAPSAKK